MSEPLPPAGADGSTASATNLPDDTAVAAAADDGSFRVVALTLTHTLEEARRAHGTLPVATAALGRALAGAALLALTYKGEGRLTLRILGNGPLGAVVADASPLGDVRGYVQNPRVLLPPNGEGKLDVGRAVGREGVLHVSHDIGLRTPYSGSVPLATGEIGDDLAVYLARSAQIPSAVTVGVRVGSGGVVLGAGGILVQRMPSSEPEAALLEEDEAERLWQETAQRVEEALYALGPVSSAVAEGIDARTLLERMFRGHGHGAVRSVPIRWQCTCSRERTGRLLIAMGPDALEEMAREDDGAELRCQFCGRVYRFTAEELQAFAASARQDPDTPEEG